MRAKIWYLYHSGFAVETGEHFLIFDYWRTTPKTAGLAGGVIVPSELREKDVVVFASHGHGDHYIPGILRWYNDIPKLRIILSSDIKGDKNAIKMKPGETLKQPDLIVQTLKSNDEGVAFVVQVDGLLIYHAGDLHWWHWEGEPDEDNASMELSYKSQIALLTGRSIDLAFAVLDPRLEEQYAWGFDYLMRTADIRHAIPMHFGGQPETVVRFLHDPVSEGYRDKIISLIKRGDTATI